MYPDDRGNTSGTIKINRRNGRTKAGVSLRCFARQSLEDGAASAVKNQRFSGVNQTVHILFGNTYHDVRFPHRQ